MLEGVGSLPIHPLMLVFLSSRPPIKKIHPGGFLQQKNFRSQLCNLFQGSQEAAETDSTPCHFHIHPSISDLLTYAEGSSYFQLQFLCYLWKKKDQELEGSIQTNASGEIFQEFSVPLWSTASNKWIKSLL